MLEAAGLTLGQSLPFAIQGYNEIFYTYSGGRLDQAAWSLRDGGSSLNCSAAIVSHSKAMAARLAALVCEPVSDDGSGQVDLF